MLHVVQYSTQNKISISMSSMSMFRREILKVIIIEVPPFLAHLSQCVRCIINSYFKGHLLNYWMGWVFTKLGRNGPYMALFIFFFFKYR